MSKDLTIYQGAPVGGVYPVQNDTVNKIMVNIMSFHPQIAEVRRRAELDAKSKINPKDKNFKVLVKKAGEEAAKMISMQFIQIALATGASPIPSTNELHILPDGRIDHGINYYERGAMDYGGFGWLDRPRELTEEERQSHMLDKGDVAVVGTAYKNSDRPHIKDDIDMGVPWKEAYLMHSVTAVGVVRKAELTHKSGASASKKGRSNFWWAEKRMKKSLFRQLFPWQPGDVRPGAGLATNDEGHTIIDGDSHEWRLLEKEAESVSVANGDGFISGGQVVGNSEQLDFDYIAQKIPFYFDGGHVKDTVKVLEQHGFGNVDEPLLVSYAGLSGDGLIVDEVIARLKKKNGDRIDELNEELF